MPPDSIPSTWEQLESTFTQTEYMPALTLAVYLVIGAVIAMYLRFLYKLSSPAASADSIARVFPLLTLVTIAVIAVVKSSLALSLGLVGALSIVRFRAAIKDPEELVYLFLCIGVGLALGAEEIWIALALVAVSSAYVLIVDRLRPSARAGDGYVTIVGPDSATFASDAEAGAVAALRELCPSFTVQRCDLDDGEGQLRVQVRRIGDGGPQLVAALQQRLPGCQISYIDGSALLS